MAIKVEKNDMILVTGAAGFIGSCMVQYLNDHGYENLLLDDDFGVEEKRKNWEGKKYTRIIERYQLFSWLQEHRPSLGLVIHLGARTDTTEFDYAVHEELNVQYSKDIWDYCTMHEVPLVYASSAATYGAGELGYADDHELVPRLQPLNPYGVSKNEFDKWVLQQETCPPFWAGLKFFNVYGPNEYHKGRMASVIWHAFGQIRKTGEVKLFRSHRGDFKNGEQLRDFIYVKDVVRVIGWMTGITPTGDSPAAIPAGIDSAIYNLGTGIARSFNDLVSATFHGMDLEPRIVYIDMPADIRDTYQYYTRATMEKLLSAGYDGGFHSLEEGIDDYVRNYLITSRLY